MLAGLLLGTGSLGDRIGHLLMFQTGLVIFGLASLAAAFAPGVWWLIAARALLGVGAAVMMPATLALGLLSFRIWLTISTVSISGVIQLRAPLFSAASRKVTSGRAWSFLRSLIDYPIVRRARGVRPESADA